MWRHGWRRQAFRRRCLDAFFRLAGRAVEFGVDDELHLEQAAGHFKRCSVQRGQERVFATSPDKSGGNADDKLFP